MPANPNHRPTASARVNHTDDEQIDVLADLLGIDRSEVIRKAIANLLALNPVTQAQREAYRRKQAAGISRSDALRVAPLVAASGGLSPALVASAPDQEKGGGENGIPRHRRPERHARPLTAFEHSIRTHAA